MAIKNRITVNLEDDEYQALLKIAGETDRSLAWLGRFAICEFLGKDGKKSEHSVGHVAEKSAPAGRGAQ